MAHPEIGPRQTVDRAKHPTLGEGRLVHRHGPSFFVADSGEWCALTNVGSGGSSSSPRRSWCTAEQDGKRIELDDTNRQSGARHDRAYVHNHGVGWLIWLIDGDCHHHRFEPDNGSVFDLHVDTLWSGLPEHKECRQKDIKSQREARAAGWMCMSDDMTTVAWCHEADEQKARRYLEDRNAPKPEKGKRGKPALSGPLPDFANMTREQIKQWKQGGA
jgi:hypothetical protein